MPDHLIELDRAALELAALDRPELDVVAYLDKVREWASRVRSASTRSGTILDASRHLVRVLALSEAFTGDRETYDHPDNLDLARVIDRRRGLPITLAILYVAVARRAGLPAAIRAMPGHVLVGIGDAHAVVIDPFSGGNLVPEFVDGNRQGGERYAGVPMTNRATLGRLLFNAASRAQGGGETVRACALFRRLTAAVPDFAPGWQSRAKLEAVLGQVEEARLSWVSLLETTRDKTLRDEAFAAMARLSSGEADG